MQNDFENINKIILIWPKNPETWRKENKPIRKVFYRLMKNISKYKQVVLIKDKQDDCKKISKIKNVEFLEIQNNDSWARDVLPFKVGKSYVEFIFNGYNGILANYQFDAQIAKEFCRQQKLPLTTLPLTFEGGDFK